MAETDVKRKSSPDGPHAAGAGPAARDESRGEAAEREGGRRSWILLIAGVAALAAVAWFAYRWIEGRKYASTDDAQVGGNTIPVLSKVSGYVSSVLVVENQRVVGGQLLVSVDSAELRERLAQAEAQLAIARQAAGLGPVTGQAEAQAQAAQASEGAARAGITQAAANAERARRDVERLRPLAEQGIVSRQQYDAARAAAEAADAQLVAARQNAQAAASQAQAARAGVGTAANQVAVAQAAVAEARLQLGYTRITAPAGGIVARKNVQPGQLVNPGQALMAVVPLDDIWVTANLKETQLKGVDPGDPATIDVDAYPGLRFLGHVESISPATGAEFSLLPPENATGNFTKVVQRVPVRIRLDAPNDARRPLRPGMSAVVKIRRQR